jgi:predicted lipoprotein
MKRWTTTSYWVSITSPKRPGGSFERPRPARAEARRSGRSLRNVVLAAEAAHGPATALADWDLPETEAAMADLHDAATHISDPAFQDVTDPKTRLRIEVLQQAVQSLNEAIQVEVGARLGIAPGYNSQDGD